MNRNIYLLEKINELKLYIEKADNPQLIAALQRRIDFLEKCLTK